MSEAQAGLERHLKWLYPDPKKPCRCTHAYKGLGRLYGISMGEGWVRMTTHPDCPHHGGGHGASE